MIPTPPEAAEPKKVWRVPLPVIMKPCDAGSSSGIWAWVAAARAAARAGRRVILTEETDWIGGQLTSQAVPPDEHPWIESFGCTRSYRNFRDGARDYYLRHYP